VGSTEQEKDIHFDQSQRDRAAKECSEGSSGNDKIVEACYDLEWKESKVDPE
jgi:hypothetical protein